EPARLAEHAAESASHLRRHAHAPARTLERDAHGLEHAAVLRTEEVFDERIHLAVLALDDLEPGGPPALQHLARGDAREARYSLEIVGVTPDETGLDAPGQAVVEGQIRPEGSEVLRAQAAEVRHGQKRRVVRRPRTSTSTSSMRMAITRMPSTSSPTRTRWSLMIAIGCPFRSLMAWRTKAGGGGVAGGAGVGSATGLAATRSRGTGAGAAGVVATLATGVGGAGVCTAGAGSGRATTGAAATAAEAGGGGGAAGRVRTAHTATIAPAVATPSAAHAGHRRAARVGQGAAAITTNPRSSRPFSRSSFFRASRTRLTRSLRGAGADRSPGCT